MRNQSSVYNLFAIVGFIIITAIGLSLLSSILAFAIKILIPIAIVVFLVRFISNPSKNNHHRY